MTGYTAIVVERLRTLADGIESGVVSVSTFTATAATEELPSLDGFRREELNGQRAYTLRAYSDNWRTGA